MSKTMVSSGVEMEVISVSGSEVKIRVGSHEIAFGRRPSGRAIKKADFFLSSGSYEDIPPVPDDQFRAAARVATAIFHSRFNGHAPSAKKTKRERKEAFQQMTLPFET